MADPNAMTTLQRAAPVAGFENPGLGLRVEQGLGIAKLRIYGRKADTRFGAIVGGEPPSAREQIEIGALTFAWLAPGEWLASGPESDVARWVEQVQGLGDDEALAIDFTHARAAFILGGQHARTALAAHCPLDLWPDAFPVNAVARSVLGDTGMFIARLADGADFPRFRIVVDQTMAAYAVRILARA